MKIGKKRKPFEALDIVSFIILTLMVIIIIFPFYTSVLVSFTTNISYVRKPVQFFPESFTLENYSYVIDRMNIFTGYKNTLTIVIIGTALTMFISLTYSYALAMRDYPGKKFFFILLLITMYFGGGLIPTYLIYRSYGLLDSILVLLLPSAVNVYNMIITRTYFSSQIPNELREAAFLDGCGEMRYLFKIVLPLSVPILAVVSLYYAVGHWNSYFDAMVYINTKAKRPLSIFLREILILNEADDITSTMDPDALASLEERKNVMKYALIVVSSVPMYILYPFVQKYFVKGIMIGSVKG